MLKVTACDRIAMRLPFRVCGLVNAGDVASVTSKA